jgi:hypothetical protein
MDEEQDVVSHGAEQGPDLFGERLNGTALNFRPHRRNRHPLRLRCLGPPGQHQHRQAERLNPHAGQFQRQLLDAKGDAITPATNWPTTINMYDADGQLIKVLFPNGTETDYDYGTYWTVSGSVFGKEIITNKRGSTVLSQFTYSFDVDRRKVKAEEMMTDPEERRLLWILAGQPG